MAEQTDDVLNQLRDMTVQGDNCSAGHQPTVEFVLKNDVVLKRLVFFLTIPDMKASRLASHSLKEAFDPTYFKLAHVDLMRRKSLGGYLEANTNGQYRHFTIPLLDPFDEERVRRSITNFSTFCARYQDILTTLRLDIDMARDSRDILSLLEQVASPLRHVKTLSFTVRMVMEQKPKTSPPMSTRIAEQLVRLFPNVRIVNFEENGINGLQSELINIALTKGAIPEFAGGYFQKPLERGKAHGYHKKTMMLMSQLPPSYALTYINFNHLDTVYEPMGRLLEAFLVRYANTLQTFKVTVGSTLKKNLQSEARVPLMPSLTKLSIIFYDNYHKRYIDQKCLAVKFNFGETFFVGKLPALRIFKIVGDRGMFFEELGFYSMQGSGLLECFFPTDKFVPVCPGVREVEVNHGGEGGAFCSRLKSVFPNATVEMPKSRLKLSDVVNLDDYKISEAEGKIIRDLMSTHGIGKRSAPST